MKGGGQFTLAFRAATALVRFTAARYAEVLESNSKEYLLAGARKVDDISRRAAARLRLANQAAVGFVVWKHAAVRCGRIRSGRTR